MDLHILSQNLRRLRVAKRLSQKALSEASGLSLLSIKNLERAKTVPRMRTVQAIAAALEVRLDDLFRPVRELKTVRFRSRKRMRNRENVLAGVARWAEDFNYLEQVLGRKSPFRLRQIRLRVARDRSEGAAGLCRLHLGLKPDEPIHDICGLLEGAGVKVLAMRIESEGFFGLSLGEEDGGPAVVVNERDAIPVERRIFSAAHELGHLVLHPGAYDVAIEEEDEAEEKEADRFAAHFLLPDAGFRKEWNDAAGLHWVDRVLKVKRIFRVSYKTVLRRLIDLGAEDDSVWGRFNRDYERSYGKRLAYREEPRGGGEELSGLKRGEPNGLRPIDFREDRFSRLVREAVESGKISISRSAEILGCGILEMREMMSGWAPVL